MKKTEKCFRQISYLAFWEVGYPEITFGLTEFPDDTEDTIFMTIDGMQHEKPIEKVTFELTPELCLSIKEAIELVLLDLNTRLSRVEKKESK